MDTSVDSLSSTETLAQSSACFSQDLSATFWQDSAHSTIQSVLSSLRQTNADIAAARAEIPTDPYERLKWEHCHRDAEPFDFNSIEVPEDFCIQETHKKLANISSSYSTNINTHLELAMLSSFNANDHPNFANAFATLSGETFEVNKDKLTNHFLFLDMIRSIPVEYIQKNPEDFAKKILTKFVQIY